ncbi:dTDP-4-dehydrorhamnose reductase [Massilia sp. IC2-278]|uniref:dTDP-4-dehydrorhamnose reductase n=1 Tax=Massilia sp. IC2-278 TaxID=2887200 RepID=UPI001E28C915|nr:dTDP-4-dehydrorhamnose reductase [Massilia sp. IC2-278]MCC2961429.1 dTDP-4-dehydrorhamnose reductase [Massilia sp. IC2-278]
MKILLFGKDGQVGWELQRALAPLGSLRALGRADADFAHPETLRAPIAAFGPDVIVNAAAYTAVDKAEGDAATAHRVNALAPGVLAEEAAACGAWLVHYSTDYVFDGAKEGAYVEGDATNPLSVYGRTKCEGEERIRASGARHLILRTSWVFSARGGNFAKTILRLAQERDSLQVVADQHGAPTGADLIADATALALHSLRDAGPAARALSGTYHLAAAGATTWHGYAQHLLAEALARGAELKAGPESVLPVLARDWPAPAARPRNSRLDTHLFEASFGLQMPDWRAHVDRLVAGLASAGRDEAHGAQRIDRVFPSCSPYSHKATQAIIPVPMARGADKQS